MPDTDSITVQMSPAQRDRVVRALELLDDADPILDDDDLSLLAGMFRDAEPDTLNGFTL
uniref:Uncharacterized protein n=1 Tax=Dinoroseobacter phage vB_DshS_R26L TaxID=3161158 RepID=A0AAU7VHS1_9CAUD